MTDEEVWKTQGTKDYWREGQNYALSPTTWVCEWRRPYALRNDTGCLPTP